MKEPLFDSKGNVDKWGKDFWSHNPIAELIIVLGGSILLVALFGLGMFLLLTVFWK